METTDSHLKGRSRPLRTDEIVIKEVVDKLMPEVLSWLQDGVNDAEELDEIRLDLIKAIGWDMDGFEIAKNLESLSPDAALVEILDYAGTYQSSAHHDLCKRWVAANAQSIAELSERFKPGTPVCFDWMQGRINGVVKEIRDDGTCVIMDSDKPGKGNPIVALERLTPTHK